jgi:serine protease
MLRAPQRPARTTNTPTAVPFHRRTALRPAFVPGHIVVKFAPTVTVQAAERMARQVGATELRRPAYADFVYLAIPREDDPVLAAALLAGEPGVVYAEPDPVRYPKFRPNDSLYRYQWHLQRTGAERLWDLHPSAGEGIVVAVLDTGVAFRDQGEFAQAPDLRGTRFREGYDFIWDDPVPVDLAGHGTFVAGVIAQTTNNGEGTAGLAFAATIMPVKVVPGDQDFLRGAPFPYGASALARGIRFAVENGARVINMSLGGYEPSTPERDAMLDAVARGAFIAISAGNEAVSCDDCPPGIGPNPVEWPAKDAEEIDGAMAVGALDYDLERAYYSNVQSYVEIAAPGGDTTQDRNGDGFVDGVLQQWLDPAFVEVGIFNQFSYDFIQGTSFSSPYVAALAALLMSRGVTNPAAVEAAIKQFAVDTGRPGRDPETGFGVCDPSATVRGLGLAR